MKNILTSEQMREADRHTIATEPIASVDLMERAALAFVKAFMQLHRDKNVSILICCGTGNNGGDGLAVARLLQQHGYDNVTVWIARFASRQSTDFATNLAKLHYCPIPVSEFFPSDEFPAVTQSILIDALLGSGLNKLLDGDWLRLVQHLNAARIPSIAVDIPTGLPADGIVPSTAQMLYAREAITFQRPKLSFFFPESAKAMDKFHVVDIGLDEVFIENLPADFKLVEASDIRGILRGRKRFSHKGTYGHALIIAGNTHTMGAALLCAGASVYSGAGLTTACIPAEGLLALNARYPEVMYTPRETLAENWEDADAVAVGPGLGLTVDLQHMLEYPAKPLVLDADALTLLARNKSLMKKLPPNSVLTPHMKEFDRLFGEHSNWWDRVNTARRRAVQHQTVIVLKNQYTFMIMPDGQVYINPTGNPAMASGGMGDVLTGMLTAFLAQGYPPQEATILACYMHGSAGDRLAAEGMAVIPATELIAAIPVTWDAIVQSNC
ncbi:yjeF C-terminal region, hydroxyethylthiazole kinase-related/yjeF N-terminal region [Parapedobacter composti]|uniref:Bifunctional NAD(P)H-hydrate repair enzyme n=1 Tax=Parapedobacter composti TaxID=623281 RepID=A0A1I1E3F9_9SPHI|nr:NAD(P)H-hydrate dehydratase [Parapedobacter composti]SFB81644.1 yjeF C-terminal region, hydroxyethylthiazole kinase-related/yjeF N-terminal region [Parapedobacter composti]